MHRIKISAVVEVARIRGVGQAAHQQADTAYQRQHAADAAKDHGHQLLLGHRQEPRVDPVWGQHAKEMAKEDAENADTK